MSVRRHKPRPTDLRDGVELELDDLAVSVVTSKGFDFWWEPKAHVVYDSYTVEYRDTLGLWVLKEVHLCGDATGSRIRGLRESIWRKQRSLTLEAVTGILCPFFWSACLQYDRYPFVVERALILSLPWITKLGFERKICEVQNQAFYVLHDGIVILNCNGAWQFFTKWPLGLIPSSHFLHAEDGIP